MKKEINLWCTNPDLAAQCVAKHFSKDSAQTMHLADEICENTFTFREHWEMERTNVPVKFDNKIDWEYIPAGDGEWTYAFNRHTSFVILAKAWLYTKNEKYAHAFERLVNSWIDNTRLCAETKCGSWRSLEAGLRCETWLRAMDIFKDCPFISEKLFDKMNISLREHAEYLRTESSDFHVLSNWGVLQDHGLFLLGLYFGDDAVCALAVSRLENNLNIQFLRDGSHWEQSPMYHCEVLHCFLDVLVAGCARRYSFSDNFKSRIHNACRALSIWVKPNGYLPMQSDTDDIDARDLLCCGAYLFGDGQLKHYAHNAFFEENVWDFGAEFIPEYRDISTIAPVKASCALRDSGNYFLRSDNTREAIWLQFHCGCLGSGHGHADQLHINLAAYGEDILIDSGRYSYVDSATRRAMRGARGHNTLVADGAEFSQQLDTWGYKTLATPIKGEYCLDDKASFVSGGHLGYLANGIFTRRRIVHIKPDIYIIADTFYTSSTHSYEQLFHFGKGDVSLTDSIAKFTGTKAIATILPLGNGLCTCLEKHPCSYEYNLMDECVALSVRADAAGSFSFITVIAISEANNNDKISAELLPVTARRKGSILPFDKACGIKINKGAREYTALLCHEELISEVELLEANNCLGYGKAVIFGENLPKTGLCLEW